MSEPVAERPALQTPIEAYLHTLHARHGGHRAGKLADYIPELARADPDAFGICIATRDGHVYEVGDTHLPFTIQSISKALVYGLALEDRGETEVLTRIGVEPSGEAFNDISLQPHTGAPFNPMINAGAIAATGLVHDSPADPRIKRILRYLSDCAGRELDIDEAVYRSESQTGHRNRAIGWMLRNFDIVEEDPNDILEAYFQQCAIRVTCRDLALMAATLANQGVNPLTHQQAIAPRVIENILSVMSTCGMYDYSGEWIYRIGLPAKSGVGGGIMAVLPGQLGIGIYSPPLDERGNSARGIRVCQDLSNDLQLHLFHVGSTPSPALRLSYDATQVGSRRQRPSAHREILQREGRLIRVLELQGDLTFATTEPIIRAIHEQRTQHRHVILSLRGVLSIDTVSLRLLTELRQGLAADGVRLLVCGTNAWGPGQQPATEDIGLHFPDDDAALVDCEDHLLAETLGPAWNQRPRLTLGDCELLQGVQPAGLVWLENNLPQRAYAQGEIIVRAGEPGNTLYLLTSGSVDVRLPGSDSTPGQRIDVFTAGMSFGEMAFIDGSPRSANVLALEPSYCYLLSAEIFNRMTHEWPTLKIQILQGITKLVSSNLRRTNREVQTFKR